MKSSIKRNLFFAIICLVLCVTIVVVNYVLDNTGGKGISNNMSTLSEYRRSLTLMIVSIVMATASVGMMCASLFVFMRRKQSEDMERLAQLEAEMAAMEQVEGEKGTPDVDDDVDGGTDDGSETLS